MPESPHDLPALPELFWQTIDDGLLALGLDLTAPQRAALDAHCRLLVAWNKHINLTALRDPEQIARSHVLDSLAAVPAIRSLMPREPRTVLDLGSGGGFPGLPVVIALPASRVALVDSVGKKARFLAVAGTAVTGALRAAGEDPPEIAALAERAEDLAQEADHRAAWDLVTVRAVGATADVAELGLPLCRRGGHVVAWKRATGDRALDDEVAAARRVCQAAGGSAPSIVNLAEAQAVGLTGHCLVVIRKVRPTPDRYPRAPGERQRAS